MHNLYLWWIFLFKDSTLWSVSTWNILNVSKMLSTLLCCLPLKRWEKKKTEHIPLQTRILSSCLPLFSAHPNNSFLNYIPLLLVLYRKWSRFPLSSFSAVFSIRDNSYLIFCQSAWLLLWFEYEEYPQLHVCKHLDPSWWLFWKVGEPSGHETWPA